MSDTSEVPPELVHQNRLLIAQIEALRDQLAARNAEIERLSRIVLSQDTSPKSSTAS